MEKEKAGLKRIENFCFIEFNATDTNNILDIHKYLMKRKLYKTVFGIIKEIFIGLLTGGVGASNDLK